MNCSPVIPNGGTVLGSRFDFALLSIWPLGTELGAIFVSVPRNVVTDGVYPSSNRMNEPVDYTLYTELTTFWRYMRGIGNPCEAVKSTKREGDGSHSADWSGLTRTRTLQLPNITSSVVVGCKCPEKSTSRSFYNESQAELLGKAHGTIPS